MKHDDFVSPLRSSWKKLASQSKEARPAVFRMKPEAKLRNWKKLDIFHSYRAYPLVNKQKAIENGLFIVDLPSYKMVDLSIVM